jgi:hypothetical protein
MKLRHIYICGSIEILIQGDFMVFNVKKTPTYSGVGGLRMRGSGGHMMVISSPSVSSITPDSLPGLVSWFKADSITGVVDGGTVTSWSDDSVNNNDLTSRGGTPFYVASDPLFNNRPVVRFNNSSYLFRSNPTGLPVGSQAMTTYVVGTWDGTTGNHNMFAWGANTTTGKRWGIGSNGASGILFESIGIGSSFRYIEANAPFAFSMSYTAGTSYSSATTYLNGMAFTGAFIDGTPSLPNPIPEISIGRPPTVAAEMWAGKVAEVIVFNTTHDDATRQGIEAYLQQKYGISFATNTGASTLTTSGLIAHLDASDPVSNTGVGTTWYDISGQGNHFTALGSPSRISTYGGGWSVPTATAGFTSGDYLQSAFANGMSVGVWVVGTTFANGNAQGIVERGSDWTAANGFGLYVHYSYRNLHGPKYNAAKGVSSISRDIPHYLMFTLSSSGIAKAFVNGRLDGKATGVARPTAGGGPVYLGRDKSSFYSFIGSVYGMHMYDRELTEEEVKSNFNATKVRFGL